MSVQQAERAHTLLYEDSSLRDALTDDEAQALLKWGDGQIDALAAKNLTDSAFEAAFTSLCEKLRAINRYVGERPNLTAKQQQVLLTAIVPDGLLKPIAQAFNAQAAGSENLLLIQQLTAQLTNKPQSNAPMV